MLKNLPAFTGLKDSSPCTDKILCQTCSSFSIFKTCLSKVNNINASKLQEKCAKWTLNS